MEAKKLKIIADNREKNSLVIAELHELGIEVEMKHLILADYIISNEIAIERKTINDFIGSIINKRLLKQLSDLKSNFKKPLLIIEGIEEHDLYKTGTDLHENAIRGMILAISTELQVPIILTKDYKDTAVYLQLLAKKQEQGAKEFSLVLKRRAYNMKDQQQMIIESFPGIGPALAKALLKKFKSIKNIINASEEELKEIPKLGKKAESIKKIIEHNY